MGAGRAAALLLPLLAVLPAAPAAAQSSWYCAVQEESGGLRARLVQSYFDADRPLAGPMQDVSASGGGMFFATGFFPHWRSLDAPFELPRRIDIGITLPERAASPRVTLFAPGVAPLALTVRIYGPEASENGVGFELRDRARIEALLTHTDWTVIVHHADGRVQQIVTVRMPMTAARLREIRGRQVARMRDMGRDPVRHCQFVDDEASIVAR